MDYDIHGKKLPVPSFFQVYNYGGGNADKDREVVYSEFTENTPALINYYYINNKIPHSFQSHSFDDLSGYEKIGDIYNDIRKKLINKGEIYSGYTSPEYDFNQKVFLLDSGAFSIVKYIANKVDYDITKFNIEIVKQMKEYYDFADQLKIDLVVAFDLGGKYTEKDGEKADKTFTNFLSNLNADEINNILLDEATKYLSAKKKYYPFVLATIHGAKQEDYSACTKYVLELEKKYNYKYWGFALGGIASYKQLDKSWYGDINFTGVKKRTYLPTVGPARACKIVREIIGEERAIHALGCGGYPNITSNYFAGATSFDTASPVRRVGDGNLESTKQVFRSNPTNSAKFSKYFTGGINLDGTLRKEDYEYVKLYLVKDDMTLCGCPACIKAGSIKNIKDLYSKKEEDSEANYYSRQLMGLHAVFQHRKLCETIAGFKTIEDFCKAYPSKLNNGLLKVFKQI